MQFKIEMGIRPFLYRNIISDGAHKAAVPHPSTPALRFAAAL